MARSLLVALMCLFALGALAHDSGSQSYGHRRHSPSPTPSHPRPTPPINDGDFVVPGKDMFVPFAKTVEEGAIVTWTNNDSDDHTVDSVDHFNTIGPKNFHYILKAGQSLSIKFKKAGLFVFRCAFHSQLSNTDQPIAPGPMGGIQDAKGNFGTPMMGVLHVKSKAQNSFPPHKTIPDKFGRGGEMGYGQDSGFGSGGYGNSNDGQGMGSYGQGMDSYGQGMGSYGQGMDSYGQGMGSYGQGMDSYGQGMDSYGQGMGSYGGLDQGSDDNSQGMGSSYGMGSSHGMGYGNGMSGEGNYGGFENNQGHFGAHRGAFDSGDFNGDGHGKFFRPRLGKDFINNHFDNQESEGDSQGQGMGYGGNYGGY